MSLLFIFIEFFKIGLFSVGGGLATLPFLFEIADKHEWLNYEMIGNFLAIAQSSPGAIGVNMAVQTGYQAGGILSGGIAALSLVSPALIIITAVSKVLNSIKENKIVNSVFAGLRPAASGLLAAAGFTTLKLSLYNGGASVFYEMLRVKELFIFACLFFLVFKFKKHPVIYIIIGAASGIIFKL